mgnify:CR=1 FL=1
MISKVNLGTGLHQNSNHNFDEIRTDAGCILSCCFYCCCVVGIIIAIIAIIPAMNWNFWNIQQEDNQRQQYMNHCVAAILASSAVPQLDLALNSRVSRSANYFQ